MSEKPNKENPGSGDSPQERLRKKEEEFRERLRKQEEERRARLKKIEEEQRARRKKIEEERRARWEQVKKEAKERLESVKEEAKKGNRGGKPNEGQREGGPQRNGGAFEKELEEDARSPEKSPFILNLLVEAREKASAYPGTLLFNRTERSRYTVDMMNKDTQELLSSVRSLSQLHDGFMRRIIGEAKARNLRATEQRQREFIRMWYTKGLDLLQSEFSRHRKRLLDIQDEILRVVRENAARGGGRENEPKPPGGGRQEPGSNEVPRPGAPDQKQEDADIQRAMNEFHISRAEYNLIIGRIQMMPDPHFMGIIERVFGSRDRESVSAAYRALAKKFHPDKGKTNRGERFKVLNALYDEYKRRVGK